MRKYLLSLPLLALIFLFYCSEEGSEKNSNDTSPLDISITDIQSIIDISDASTDSTIADVSAGTDSGIEDINDISVPDVQDISSQDISDVISEDIAEDSTQYDIQSDSSSDIPTDTELNDIQDSGYSDIGYPPVRLNEVMIIPKFSDTELGQYIEIYNPNDIPVDLNGYKIKTENREFIISNSQCDSTIAPKKFKVIGATTDPSKNSYAKVTCEWKDVFSLTGAKAISLYAPDNTLIDKFDLSGYSIRAGSSIERAQNGYQDSPSLITFLEDTGLYSGDRGSPNRTNYRLIMRSRLNEGIPYKDRIENENDVHRYPVNLLKGDIIAFYADVDRINGDLKLFGSLLNANGDFITPARFVSDITYDYFIYHIFDSSGTYYFQIQSDFFYQFVPANIEATYFRADELITNKSFIELKVGDSFKIQTYATFSQNKDLEKMLLPEDMLEYSSNDSNIASISNNGLITAIQPGSTTIYISYNYIDNHSLDTNITVNVYNNPDNETCDRAIDATNGLKTYASTIGAKDDYNPQKCVFSMFSGGDIVYYVDAPAGVEYEVIVTPFGDFDPMIYVLEDCSNPECIYGTVFNGPGEVETLKFKNETFSLKRYYIIIDGEAGDDGTFSLEINRK